MQAKVGNSVIVCGTLPRDSEYKIVGDKSTPLCKFGLKVDEKLMEDGTRQAVWCNCVCWRDVAKVAEKFEKGDTVLAIGKIQTRTYDGRDGETKTASELVCEAVFVMDRAHEPAVDYPAATSSASKPNVDFEEIVSDDDLPF